MSRVPVGLMGCGKIAPAYLKHLTGSFSRVVEVVACADIIPEAARARAAEFGVPRACSPEDLLADRGVELVINLTTAPLHYEVSRQILAAGKHLFSEKPLALNPEEGADLLARAAAAGLRVGGAADTFLGSGHQQARRLIDEGRIGTPIAATAFVSVPLFHNERYHSVFRGALFDLGPYYLAALVTLLGPVTWVASRAEIRFPEKPDAPDSTAGGTVFKVDVPTTVAAALEFADGTVGTLIASCDVHGYLPRVEIYGRAGLLTLGDANHYGGVPTLSGPEQGEALPAPSGFGERGRGLGVAEMALAIREGQPPRASGELTQHILEVMDAVHRSSQGGPIAVTSRPARPGPFDAATVMQE